MYSGVIRVCTLGVPGYVLRGYTGMYLGGTRVCTRGVPGYALLWYPGSTLGVSGYVLWGYPGMYSGDTRVYTRGVPGYVSGYDQHNQAWYPVFQSMYTLYTERTLETSPKTSRTEQNRTEPNRSLSETRNAVEGVPTTPHPP